MRAPIHSRIAAILLLTAVLLAACQSNEEKLAGFLERGRTAIEAQEYKEAIIEFRNVLQLDPNHAEAHYALAKAYVATNKPKEAFWELHESVRLDPDNLEARRQFAQFSLIARDYEEVITQTDALIAATPEDPIPYALRGDALQGLERPEEAEEAYKTAAEVSGDKSNFLLPLIQFYARQGREPEARPFLEQLVEAEPNHRSYTLLGRSLARQDDPEAEEAFRKALEVAKGKTRIDGYRSLAGYLVSQKREDEAIALLEQGIDVLEDDLDLIYTLASLRSSKGDVEGADALVRQAAAESPDDARPHLVLSSYLGRKGDLEGALASAEDALAAEPNNRDARLRKAELLVDLGYREKRDDRVAEGRRVVEEVLADSPTDPQALFVRAKIELAQLDPQSAADSLRAALDSRPDWASAHFVLGTALMLLGDQNGARGEFARAVELDPSQLEARRALARVHASLGEHEYSVEQARLYLRERPDDIRTRILVAQGLVNVGKQGDALRELESIDPGARDADVWYALGRLKLAAGDVESGRSALLEANQLHPNNPDILRNLHLIDRRTGRLDQSEARIATAVASAPDSSKIVQLQGLVALARGDLKGAEAAFKKATDLDPDDMSAYQQLATFYRATGRIEDSIATLDRSLAEQPKSPRLHERIAILHEMNGAPAKAIEHYEKAIELDPNLGEAKNNLAYLLASDGGDLDRALDLAQEAKALLPDSPQAADTLGWVLYKRGIPSAAIGYLREAANGMGLDEGAAGVIHHHLALAYEANKQPDKAIESAERAIASQARLLDRARQAGQEVTEPQWVAEARALVARLKSS